MKQSCDEEKLFTIRVVPPKVFMGIFKGLFRVHNRPPKAGVEMRKRSSHQEPEPEKSRKTVLGLMLRFYWLRFIQND